MGRDANEDAVIAAATNPARLEDILQLLQRLLAHLQLSTYEIEVQHGITAPQASCLGAIVLSGPMTHVELGRLVQLSASAMTSILNRLEARGLIDRSRMPGPGRRIMIAATPAGMNWSRPRDHAITAEQEREFAALPRKQQQGIVAALECLARILKAR